MPRWTPQPRRRGFQQYGIDAAVSAEVLSAISPLALDAALQLIADRERAAERRCGKVNWHCNKRAEEIYARRQYATDPDNQLVAGESNADG
jgi:hypothetical protein